MPISAAPSICFMVSTASCHVPAPRCEPDLLFRLLLNLGGLLLLGLLLLLGFGDGEILHLVVGGGRGVGHGACL